MSVNLINPIVVEMSLIELEGSRDIYDGLLYLKLLLMQLREHNSC